MANDVPALLIGTNRMDQETGIKSLAIPGR